MFIFLQNVILTKDVVYLLFTGLLVSCVVYSSFALLFTCIVDNCLLIVYLCCLLIVYLFTCCLLVLFTCLLVVY